MGNTTRSTNPKINQKSSICDLFSNIKIQQLTGIIYPGKKGKTSELR
ncbi:unnamed protein product [Paramecium octaurelia]|uniref:Uncharacterized protein n=1 Tax=Paramecium octaurelia TaxID=43137 RepID=A0A8S1U9E4_PAROT|nr:unnamed protein product [Paramecium octaurelia]